MKSWIVSIDPGPLARVHILKGADEWRLQLPPSHEGKQMDGYFLCAQTEWTNKFSPSENWAALQLPLPLLQTHPGRKDQYSSWVWQSNLSSCLKHRLQMWILIPYQHLMCAEGGHLNPARKGNEKLSTPSKWPRSISACSACPVHSTQTKQAAPC